MTINETILRCLSASLTILIAENKLDGDAVLKLLDERNYEGLYESLNDLYKIIKTSEEELEHDAKS